MTTYGPLAPDDSFEKCRLVYEEFEDSGSINAAAAAAGVRWNTAQRWLSDPKKWDPYLDEVALDRALTGEYEVYQALTRWEIMEFYRRLILKRELMGESSMEWQHYKRMVREGVGLSEAAIDRNLCLWGQRNVNLVAA